ncbi:hypothetical protein LTV02_10965 [Nocardia yamanashiensis]|uniref:hypothetical protein n=1 Tax=Nocardia yamanashiensis TaxID=209247 RepID=UPI000ABAF23B|nr:hypothetical protein [Nocardia yamanashiensis]UGT43866.1 hypothetical protein LTV02_10965 [Nocardia yamanashiensis]
MSATQSHVRKSMLVRAGVVATSAAAILTGFAGPATAVPSDQATIFSTTVTRIPGPSCAAIINATVVPQQQSGVFGVKVRIVQDGEFCSTYRIAVRWKNLDSGLASGQSNQVNERGVVQQAPDGVITGFGMGPGAGRVEAKIVTLYDDGSQRELEQVSGAATFTLG